MNQIPNPNAIAGSPFQYAAPEGSAKTMSAGLSDIVWLMSQSPIHKSFFISRTERGQLPIMKNSADQLAVIGIGNCPRACSEPVFPRQFRQTFGRGQLPIRQSRAVSALTVEIGNCPLPNAESTSKLRPQDWKSGDSLWVVETIAPQPAPAKAGGGSQEMVNDLKAAVFPDREIRMMVVKDGKRESQSK